MIEKTNQQAEEYKTAGNISCIAVTYVSTYPSIPTLFTQTIIACYFQSLYHDYEKFKYKTKHSTHREFIIYSGKMCNASPLPIELGISKTFCHVLLSSLHIQLHFLVLLSHINQSMYPCISFCLTVKWLSFFIHICVCPNSKLSSRAVRNLPVL